MLGAERDDTTLAGGKRHSVIPKSDIKHAAPDDNRLGRVVMCIPTPGGASVDPNKAHVDASEDRVVLLLTLGGEAVENRAKV
jgi:hypothetical protein